MKPRYLIASLMLCISSTSWGFFEITTTSGHYFNQYEGTCDITIDEVEPFSYLNGLCRIMWIDPQGGPAQEKLRT